MICRGGERVTLTAGVPKLSTIGICLGRIVRFCGHTGEWYSVLGHSFTVAALMPSEEGIYGLMHDSQEVIFSDVPSPMKSRVARNREHAVQERIYNAYGIPLPSEEVLERVEEADHLALVAEANVLGHVGVVAQWGTDYDELAGKLTAKYLKKCLKWIEPAAADYAFTKEFNRYYALAGLNKPAAWE